MSAPLFFCGGDMENKTYYLTYVVGERGVGKTTLLAHFATEYMIPPRSISDLLQCRREIERLRAGGWDNLSLAPHVQHLVYVVDDTFIARGLGYKPRVSMELQFEKIGLYDGVHEVDYLLPYAKIFLPEIQSKLDSRKSMTAERVADYFLRYIERQRKVGVQMWADTQIDDSADKRFRSLSDKLIEVQNKRDFYDHYGRLVKTVWNCYEFSGVRQYARYKDSGNEREANRVGLGWDIEKEQRVFPLLFFALLPFDKFAACSVNIIIVCVLLRLGLPSGNNARDTIQENVLQITFRLVQTRLLLAQREGFEPPDSCPSTVFKTAAFDHSAISAQRFNILAERTAVVNLFFCAARFFCPSARRIP